MLSIRLIILVARSPISGHLVCRHLHVFTHLAKNGIFCVGPIYAAYAQNQPHFYFRYNFNLNLKF